MANTLKKDSIVFIDEVNGFNSGINVIELKETLRKVGICVADSYSSSVTHFIYCLFTDDMKRAVPRSDCNSETESGIEDIRCKHAELCSLAVSQGKVIVSIERITTLVNTLRAQIGYPSIKHSGYLSSDGRTYSVSKPVIIRDKTKHYKAVSLVR